MKAKLLRWGLLLCCAGFLLFGLGLCVTLLYLMFYHG